MLLHKLKHISTNMRSQSCEHAHRAMTRIHTTTTHTHINTHETHTHITPKRGRTSWFVLFSGLYSKVLATLEEATPTRLDNGHINIDKLRSLYKVCVRLRECACMCACGRVCARAGVFVRVCSYLRMAYVCAFWLSPNAMFLVTYI